MVWAELTFEITLAAGVGDFFSASFLFFWVENAQILSGQEKKMLKN